MFRSIFPPPALVGPARALPGHTQALEVPPYHPVLGNALSPPFPPHLETALFGMGCFWGAERRFWQTGGVWSTQVGYAGGHTPHPTYDEVCTGRTDHAEVVRVIFDPHKVSYAELLRVFFENHDPTQGMKQGADVGTPYRSVLFVYSPAQRAAAERTLANYQAQLSAAGHGPITTELHDAPEFYYAEAYHQQYLHKNPGGYCGLGGTGVSCPVGLGAKLL